MTTQNFSIEDLAMSLIDRLDRKNIFPPFYNNPETLISSLNHLSLRRPRRSPNAFLLCRKNVHQEAKRRGTCNMRVISKVTGILWRNASPEEKGDYEKLADRVNELHCKRATLVYRQNNTPSLIKNKQTSSSNTPQLNASLEALLNAPLNIPLSLPVSNSIPSISQLCLNNSSNYYQKDNHFLNNSNNYLSPPLGFNNQIVDNNNHNEQNSLLSYIYNNYNNNYNNYLVAPQNF